MTTSIQALPSHTVRSIGSAQVILDPSSVVKELIENALDARATCVSVEISLDTVGSIHVRDNGHGIPPEDRPIACLKHYTSKIRDFDDIMGLGGRSLGFRGEALAAIAAMSAGLVIITRVEGEPTAIKLTISKDGAVKNEERASYAIGTNVKVTNLFENFPVRKQAAEKNSTKCLGKVKGILQSYALARTAVRISLKVLKSQNDRNNWTYAPKTTFSPEDTGFKVLGRACTSQCNFTVFKSNGYTLHALLPRIDAQPAKISNVGQFMAVDSRPLSCSHGISKKIVALFKERLQSCTQSLHSVKDPCLWMNIFCPPNTYDPNIEPAKDDVLFDDSHDLLAAIEEFFAGMYQPASSTEAALSESREYGKQTDSFGDPASTPATREENNKSSERPTPEEQRKFRTSMYGCDEGDLGLIIDGCVRPTQWQNGDEEDAIFDIGTSNPWTIARMNAATRKPLTNKDIPKQSMTPQRKQNAHLLDNSPSDSEFQPLQIFSELPTPQPTSPLSPDVSQKVTQSDSYKRTEWLLERQLDRDPTTPCISGPELSKRARSYTFIPVNSPIGTSLRQIQEFSEGPKRSSRPPIGHCDSRSSVAPFTYPRTTGPVSISHNQSVHGPVSSNGNRDIRNMFSTKTRKMRHSQDPIIAAANNLIVIGGTAKNQQNEGVQTPKTTQGLKVAPAALDIPSSNTIDSRGNMAQYTSNYGKANPFVASKHLTPTNITAFTSRSQKNCPESMNALLGYQEAEYASIRDAHSVGALRRSKSARLPMERIPENSHMHNLNIIVCTTTQLIHDALEKLDIMDNFSPSYRPLNDFFTTIGDFPSHDEVGLMTERLLTQIYKLHPNQEISTELVAQIRESVQNLYGPFGSMRIT